MEKIKVALNKIFNQFVTKFQGEGKRVLLGATIGAFVGFIGISAVVGILIYKQQSENSFVKAWASAIPYPAAIVRWRVITYADYIKDFGALKHFYAEQQKATGLPAPVETQLEQAVLDRLIRNIALRRAATAKDITLNQEEIENKFNETVAEVGTKEDAEKLIQDLYGWDSETFKKRVLIYYMLEQKLSASFSNADAFDEAVQSEISKLKEIRFFGRE